MSSPVQSAPTVAATAAAEERRATIVTDRASFEREWQSTLEDAGLSTATEHPDGSLGLLQRGAAVVLDATTSAFDDDELLAYVGLARALGAMVVAVLPRDAQPDDVLDDLCLVVRRPEDAARAAAAVARRTDPDRARRFEFLTVSPRGGELLAILGDASAALIPRPVAPQDDLSEIVSIALAEDAGSATLRLGGGASIVLNAASVATRATLKGDAKTNGAVDGAKLGQRIRELRLAAGLTQAELARRTGIHRPNIARVEAGRHTPSLETIARLASAIGVPTTRVLDED